MKRVAPASFGAQLKAHREAAGFTQEELATIAGLSVHAVSALERGERRRPHRETVRALSAALDLSDTARDHLFGSARPPLVQTIADELSGSSSLPSALTRLIGRDRDLQSLRVWLADPTLRLMTLVGPGGVGKTRLAMELARELAAQTTTRVAFVGLAPLRDASSVASALAQGLGLSDGTERDLPARARRSCADHPALLVLDNFEHVLGAAPLVADLLTSVPSLRVLCTSRTPLRVRGEREYAVEPLALPADADGLQPADLARSPAIRLFVERARDVQPDFRLTSANGPIVTAICRRLDALPLALELTAPWLKVLTPEDLLRRLKHDVLPAMAAPRDLPERQKTMNATVAWSYQLLDEAGQRTFRRLSALPGRFSIEAAAAVLGSREGLPATRAEALDAVAGLIEKSLVLRETAAARPRYEMLETVRDYAALELTDAADERGAALSGLARYCLDEASMARDGLVGPNQGEWLDRVRDDLENYRGAFAWLMSCGRSRDACEIAWALVFFWMIRGQSAEGLKWYQQILSLPSLEPADESRALVGAAHMWFTQGEHTQARVALMRVLTVVDRDAEMDVIARAENLLGYVEDATGNQSAAVDRFTRSVGLFRSLASAWGTGNALNGLARVALRTGDLDRAERLLDDAVAALGQGGPWFVALALAVRANLEVRRGNPDAAIASVRESLAQIRTLHDKYAVAYVLVSFAAAVVLKGNDQWAARILGARDAVTDRTGATVVDRWVQEVLARTEREARTRLGPDRWARAYAAGRRTSIDALMTDIDRA